MEFNPFYYKDFYKEDHISQYPKGITKIYVNFTPRSTRVEGAKGSIFFGLQAFIKDVFINQFQRNFFFRPWSEIESFHREWMRETLGVTEPKMDHVKALHTLGYIPLDIYAVPEGTMVPFGVPAMVLVNNLDGFQWLPNFVETMMSNYLWPACTSASTALRYRQIFTKAARRSGHTDLGFVDWQGHDFSYRGMMGTDAAAISGMGHLLSFNGTDTEVAILAAKKFYDAKLSVGGSVPATEHSVMCAGGKENEDATYDRLLFDVYPSGIVSVVSDTWDLWRVLNEYIPSRRKRILEREGKLVIRPDSGDPVKILTGDDKANGSEYYGALSLLAAALGTTGDGRTGQRLVNKAGLIYGDSITPERATEILERAYDQGFSPYNFVFGIGSYTYQYVTRDTYNFAFKATAVERDYGKRWYRKTEAIFKDPITDNAHKKSHRGIPVAMKNGAGDLYTFETLNWESLTAPQSAFRKVFDGALLIDETFDTLRSRVRGQSE